MKNIITVTREFGSGGRELAKRLAAALGYQYYDKEIITAMAQRSHYDATFIENFPYQVHHSFAVYSPAQKMATEILLLERKVILEIAAKGNCVIVGRGADLILRAYQPLNIFVYADNQSRLHRCQVNAPAGENLNEKQLLKKIHEIDKARQNHYLLLGGDTWGRKENYHLCVNSTNLTVKNLVPAVAAYAQAWFKEQA